MAFRCGYIEGCYVRGSSGGQTDQRGIGDVGNHKTGGHKSGERILVIGQHTDDRVLNTVQTDTLSNAVRISNQFGGGSFVNDTDIAVIVHVGAFQPPAHGKLQVLNFIIVGRGAVNGNCAGFSAGHTGNSIGGIGSDAAESLFFRHPFFQIGKLYRISLVIGNGYRQHTAAQTSHRIGDGAGGTVDQTDQNNQSHNADDDAQHGQHGTHFVGADGAQRHFERKHYSVTSVIRPSKM